MKPAARQRTSSPPTPVRHKGELFGRDREVYREVVAAVMSHRIPPGTKLTESVLCEALQVSRAVARMGLLRLAHDGIVELRPNRGAAVASPSLKEAHEIYEARRVIEGAIVERLCGSVSRTSRAELARMVAAGVRSFERGRTAEWISSAGRFHVRLAELHGNTVMVQQVRELVSRSNLITALYLSAGTTVFSAKERVAIVELLEDGAAATRRKARRSMERLLHGVEDRLRVVPHDGASVDLRGVFNRPMSIGEMD